MTTITALNVRLGMDASNFSNGVDLARSEVNRVASILRQSVPPAEKFKREVELLDKAFNEAGRSTKQYENALDFLMKKYQQGQYSAEVMARAKAKEAEQARIAAANIKAQEEAVKQQLAREREASRQAVKAAKDREEAQRRLRASVIALSNEQTRHNETLRRHAAMMRGAREEAQKSVQPYNQLAMTVGRFAGAYLSFQGIKSGLAIASDIEQAAIAFEVMTGSAETGKKTLDDLRKFAAATPLTLSGSQQAAKTLLAFGVSAEKVMPTLRMLGDVSGGNQERFQSLALAYGQTTAAGRLMGQEVLQLVNAGFNPLQEISRTTGQSMAELKKQMENGAISAEMVTKAFESATGQGGRFFGMMDRMGATALGSYNQLISSVQELVAQVGKHLLPVLASAAKAIESVVRSTSGLIGGMDKSQAQVLAMVGAFGATVAIVPKVIAAFGAIRAAIKAMTTAQVTALAFTGPKGWAVIAAGAAAAALAVNEVNKAFERMNEEAAKASGGDGANKAAEAVKAAAASQKVALSPLEKEFLSIEHKLNEQVKLLNLGEDAYRRQQLYLKGMSIDQVNRIEQLHQEIKLVEERNRREKEAADDRKRKIEEMRKAAADAFTRDIGQAVENAKKYFAEEAKRQKEIRDAVSKGPGSGMEVGSAEAIKFAADQQNAAIGAAVAPQRPTPGEEAFIREAKKQFQEIQATRRSVDAQKETLRMMLIELRENGWGGVG